MELEFCVSIRPSGLHYEFSEDYVTVSVSEEELALLRKCAEEERKLQSCPGLEELSGRILTALREQDESGDEDFDWEAAEYFIELPDEPGESVELEFEVTVCLGRGDGGDVVVTEAVTPKEYRLLKYCCREDMEIDELEELEELYDRVSRAAWDESCFCAPSDGDDEDGDGESEDDEDDYSCASYIISIPDRITDEVLEED